MIPADISYQSIQEFFNMDKSLYIIGANSTSNLQKIVNLLPNKQTGLNQQEIEKLTNDLTGDINDYIIIGAKGAINNYWFIYGNPKYWANRLKKDFIIPSATLKKFSNDIYTRIQLLNIMAPVVQIQRK